MGDEVNHSSRGSRVPVGREANHSREGFNHDFFRDMQQDAVSLRATACVPPLIAALSDSTDPSVKAAVALLRDWDGRVEPDLVAPTLFNVFFTFWSKRIAAARFDGETAELLSKQAEGIASRLLADDPQGWFPAGQRVPTIQRVFQQTLAYLNERFGPTSSTRSVSEGPTVARSVSEGLDMSGWQWSRLHVMPLKHVLANRGELGQLLNHGGVPVKGDMTTVCNTGCDPNWLATTGAGYRLIADLSTKVLMAVDGQSQSGNPGTPHYSDQLNDWLSGRYHPLPLDRGEVSKIAVARLDLRPA